MSSCLNCAKKIIPNYFTQINYCIVYCFITHKLALFSCRLMSSEDVIFTALQNESTEARGRVYCGYVYAYQ